jgi:hypothetical protein
VTVNDSFYVYAYLDPRKPGSHVYGDYEFDFEPIYIGKGRGRRIKGNHAECRYLSFKLKKILKSGKRHFSIKVKENLAEHAAMLMEINLIKLIGRADKNMGPLTNLTDGGEGASGAIRSKAVCIKQAASLKGFYCKNGSPLKGIKLSKSHIEKITLNNGKISNWLVVHPNRKMNVVKNLRKFCKQNSLLYRSMLATSSGKYAHHKEYFCLNLSRMSEGEARRIAKARYKYILTSPDEEKYHVMYIRAFCEQKRLNERGIYKVLCGQRKQYKGWRAEHDYSHEVS